VIGFADDLVITVRGNNDSILSERMQSALNYVIGWCKQGGPSINPAITKTQAKLEETSGEWNANRIF
jgi:hypothetical protein